MANFTFLTHAGNHAAAVGAGITASSTAAGYSTSDALSMPISKTHRFASTAESYEIDLGSAKEVNLISVVNHNLSSGASITVRAGASPSPSTVITTIAWRDHDLFKVLSSPQTYRYWKIEFSDAGNPDTFIQVGYVMIGSGVTLAKNFAFGWKLRQEFQNVRLESEFGVPNIVRLFRRVSADFEFRNQKPADMDVLRNFVISMDGDAVPFFWIPDPAKGDGYFGRIVGDFEETVGKYRTVDLRFVEDSRGRTLL